MSMSKEVFFECKENKPHIRIILSDSLEEHFLTQQRVFFVVSDVQKDTITLAVCFQTFTGTLEFSTTFHRSEIHTVTEDIFRLLIQSSFVSISIYNLEHKLLGNYQTSFPEDDRILLREFLGELREYEAKTKLQTTLLDFPKGFCVPYTQHDRFELLLKVEDALFEKMYLSSTENVRLEAHVENNLLVLTVFNDSFPLGSIRFSKKQICNDILDDFETLLTTNRLFFVIGSSNIERPHYLFLPSELHEDTSLLLSRFLFSGTVESAVSS